MSVRYKPVEERLFLSEVDPVKRVKARAMCASASANFKWMLVDVCAQRAGGVKPMPPIRGSDTAAEIAREFLGPKLALQEVVGVLLLSSDLSPVGFAMPHVGGLSASVVEVAAVLRPALLMPASVMMLIHNHPSGRLSPSQEDINITRRVKEGGKLVGVQLIDHLIVAPGTKQYFSFADQGVL